MNQELQTALTTFVTKTMTLLESGAGFVQDELPDVIRQLLLWKAIDSFMWFAIFVSLTFFMARYARHIWCNTKPDKYGDDSMKQMAVIPLLFSVLFALVARNCSTWLQILVAPKVYLLQYVASLVK